MSKLVASLAVLCVVMLLPAAVSSAPDRGIGYFLGLGYANLRIPEGHLPPPGACRIWYPGRPAGHQPPPDRCERLQLRVPPGAWLITRPRNDVKHVRVLVYDAHQPGIVIIIGVFEAFSGIFIREFRP